MESIESRLQDIQTRRKDLEERSAQTLQSMRDVANESLRVADYAHNAEQTIKDLDAEFESQTGLTKQDIVFLFFATALQTVRWILMPKLGEKIDQDKRLQHNDKSIKDDTYKKRQDFWDSHKDKWDRTPKRYKPWWEIIWGGAPYDVTKGTVDLGIELGGGKYHRLYTLGHDPILGWLFGTCNFITDTLTYYNFESYRVENNAFTGEKLLLSQLFHEVKDSLDEDIHRLPAAVIAQAIHLESDKYTKCGLPVPILVTLSKSSAEKIYKQYDWLYFEKYFKIGASGSIAMLINRIVGVVHGLFYDKSKDGQEKMYQVRTRKILSYSNLLASTSNVLYVAVSASLGNVDAASKFDIGGFIVTLYRLISDYTFIQKIKEEFIFGNFRAKIQDSDGVYILT